MTLLVMSDTHGRIDRVREVLRIHSEASAVIFLGDGLRDLPEELICSEHPRLYAVSGNCDPFLLGGCSLGEEALLDFGGYRFLLMHGHRHGVKSGRENALAYASARGADVLLYGHTHVPEERYLPTEEGGKPMWVFNPGSLGVPWDGLPSYGLIQIRGRQILFSHGTL